MSNATQGARFSGTWAVPPEVLASLTLDVAHSPVPPPLRVAVVVGGPDGQGYSIDLGEVRLREWVPTGNNQKTCRVQSHGIWEDGTCWVRRQIYMCVYIYICIYMYIDIYIYIYIYIYM